jgi:hypothetical protein
MYLSFQMLVRQAMQATTFLKPKENANMAMNMYQKSVGENHAAVLKSVTISVAQIRNQLLLTWSTKWQGLDGGWGGPWRCDVVTQITSKADASSVVKWNIRGQAPKKTAYNYEDWNKHVTREIQIKTNKGDLLALTLLSKRCSNYVMAREKKRVIKSSKINKILCINYHGFSEYLAGWNLSSLYHKGHKYYPLHQLFVALIQTLLHN